MLVYFTPNGVVLSFNWGRCSCFNPKVGEKVMHAGSYAHFISHRMFRCFTFRNLICQCIIRNSHSHLVIVTVIVIFLTNGRKHLYFHSWRRLVWALHIEILDRWVTCIFFPQWLRGLLFLRFIAICLTMLCILCYSQLTKKATGHRRCSL